jgi:hypothetical protein
VTATHAGTRAALFCSAAPGSEYFAIPLVTTKNVPGTAYVKGQADVTWKASPYGVAISADGSYHYDIHIALPGLPDPGNGAYVAWITTTQVDEIRRLGELDDDGRLSHEVDWNKFLVVITLEDDPVPDAERWSGPVAFRGMSRSGSMHTMAGHGPFQTERCATFGYSN